VWVAVSFLIFHPLPSPSGVVWGSPTGPSAVGFRSPPPKSPAAMNKPVRAQAFSSRSADLQHELRNNLQFVTKNKNYRWHASSSTPAGAADTVVVASNLPSARRSIPHRRGRTHPVFEEVGPREQRRRRAHAHRVLVLLVMGPPVPRLWGGSTSQGLLAEIIRLMRLNCSGTGYRLPGGGGRNLLAVRVCLPRHPGGDLSSDVKWGPGTPLAFSPFPALP